jgi:16S rRNA (adenine1518-N6/adenine1519-N6)-dimethyltransferase
MSLADIRKLLSSHSLSPRKSLGQNFCGDPQLLAAIARDAELQPDELALEIGTGTGALTLVLTKTATRVLSLELDAGLAALARRELGEIAGLRLLEGDALERKNALNPALLEAIGDELARPELAALQLVANLPYAVATPILMLLLASDLPLRGVTVLVQREAAERFLAKPGNDAYGIASVLTSNRAQGRITRVVPRDVFYPRPRVESAVLRLEVGDKPRCYQTLGRVTRLLFAARRKTLRAAWRIAERRDARLTALDAVLEDCQLEGSVRVERLTAQDFLRLAQALDSIAESD